MTTSNPHLAAFASGNTAVITGGASGIGLAAARRYADLGMNVVIADRGAARLEAAEKSIIKAGASADKVLVSDTDVSRLDGLKQLAAATQAKFGAPSVLMNNAGIGDNPGKAWENPEAWHRLIEVNFWGVAHGTQAFAPMMLESGKSGIIINTGSKQGITTPPGNLAYNVSKSAVKSFTEGLAHDLRNIPGASVSAHLLIPGFTYTGITGKSEKPAGAWTGEQVIDFMLEAIGRGDFYILCPDNEVTRDIDEKRMEWAAGDVIHNRPALSRWHPDFADAFQDHMKG
ncbi:MAG: SDR family NAD(P)-dependent oxidoreductase [Rhizobiaceae bacterium]|nr:SDR family NAD(P)-dependent oxidoreductase [Rhizobiaceae bacterium]